MPIENWIAYAVAYAVTSNSSTRLHQALLWKHEQTHLVEPWKLRGEERTAPYI